MKVMVTGGNGFLGSRIAARLAREGHEVYSVQRSDPAVIQKHEEITYMQADLSDRDSMMPCFEGIEAVFHVAALTGMWGTREEFYSANVTATENVIEACRQHGIPRLIYTSTPSVVFTGEPIQGWDESVPYGENWLCHYAETKSIAEAMVLSPEYADDFVAVALRPHLIWGDKDPHMLPRLVNRARAGELKIVGDGTNKVDLTHVENATQGHICAFRIMQESPEKVRGKAYFISDGEPVVLWDWINNLLERLDIDPVTETISFNKAYRAAGLMEFFYRVFGLDSEPPMTRFIATELAKDHYFDISAAKKDLRYRSIINNQTAMDKLVEYLGSF